MKPFSACPRCNGRLTISRKTQVGSLLQRYRHCPGCDYRDKILSVPEQIVSAQIVRGRTTGPTDTANQEV